MGRTSPKITYFVFIILDTGKAFEIKSSYVFGAMAEWSNAAVLKTVIPLLVSGVQIPLAPYLTEHLEEW